MKLWMVLVGAIALAATSPSQIGTPDPWGMVTRGNQRSSDKALDYQFLTRFADQYRAGGVICAETPILSICFAPDTPPEYVDWMIGNLPTDGVQAQYSLSNRWTSTSYGSAGSMGSPISLRWSVLPDGVSIGSGVGEPVANNVINSVFTGGFGSNIWITKLGEGYARWSQLANITYAQVSDDGAAFPGTGGSSTARGDIRVGAHPIDGASGVLAYTYYPNGGDQIFDSQDVNNYKNSANNYRFFRNTSMHEHGHGLGFDHVWPINGTKLMEPLLSTAFDGPQDDDIRAGQRYYGDILENNDTSATATNLGNPSGGVTYTGLSTDSSSDTDWFKITVGPATSLSVSITPIGSTYQVGNDSSNTPTINTLAINNLAFDIRKSDGTTILLTQNATGAGSAESVSGYALPAAGGTFYIRVYDVAGSVDDVQRYDFTASTGTLPMTLSGTVTLEAFSGVPATVPITLEILDPGTTTVRQTFSITGGAYSVLPTVPSGTYDLRFRATYRWLHRRLAGVTLTSGVNTDNVSLSNGDVNGSNNVDLLDVNGIVVEFGGSGPYPSGIGWSDLDGNGTTDLLDLNALLVNFGLTGDN